MESDISIQDTVMIFDTTLRDGEQSPGAALNVDEKVEIARVLEAMGVNIIEDGFPISSPGDFRAVQRISQEIRHCVVCGLTRANRKDIDAAAEALRGAAYPRIHTGLGVSDVHVQHKLRTTRQKRCSRGWTPSGTLKSLCTTCNTMPRTPVEPIQSIFTGC